MIDDDCCSKQCMKISLSVTWNQFCAEVKTKIIEDRKKPTAVTQKKNIIGCALSGTSVSKFKRIQ